MRQQEEKINSQASLFILLCYCFRFSNHQQGSILSVVAADGSRVFAASYDEWGQQRVTLNAIGFSRGYTAHEMMPQFGIINMNGRLYDPLLARFFSPDNYVQQPTNSQNFNRYSYCLNNPLKYTDPSGELLAELFASAFISAVRSMMGAAQAGTNVWKAGAKVGTAIGG